ncbi:acyl-CoA dehydrogenase family protein [Streptomyces sp. NPDC090445]|uniref:acyl-CoA dehydrogenase family protein n=1 Tax=Streptomyces sp. NPDC090445 TaxID=3365963 RepID=UPI003828FA17
MVEHLLTADEAAHHAALLKDLDRWRGEPAHWDRAGRLPEPVIRWCREQRLTGAALPAELGGGGWDAVRTGLLYEAMGRVSASLASLVNVHDMAAQVVVRWGTEEQRRDVLPPLANGSRLAAIAMTEPQAGSDLSGIETNLEERDGRLLLNGCKVFITFGQQADVFLVFAQRAGQSIACLVDRDQPGLTVTPMGEMLGLRAAALGRLEFRDCEISPSAVVGRDGFGLAVLVPLALEHGRHAVAWMAAGMLHEVFLAASEYALERRAFGRALIEHGQVQSLITRMGTDLEATRHLCLAASRALDSGDSAATDRVLTAKYFACRVLEEHSAQAVQLLAAQGALESGVTARVYRDAKVLNILEGTTQILERMLAPRLASAARRRS